MIYYSNFILQSIIFNGFRRFQFLIQLSKLSLQPKIKEITPLLANCLIV